MLDGDLGLSMRQPHNQGLTCGSELGGPTLQPSGGQPCSISAPVSPHILPPGPYSLLVPLLCPPLALLGRNPISTWVEPSLSWAKAKELTVVPSATVLKSSAGGRRAGLMAALAPACSQMPVPGYLGQGRCPWAAFWVLHVGGEGGQPSLTSWGTLSSLLCHHPRAFTRGLCPSPLSLSLVQEGGYSGARGQVAKLGGCPGAYTGVGEREREKGELLPPPLPSAGSQPSPLPPPRLVRGRCGRGGAGASVSL